LEHRHAVYIEKKENRDLRSLRIDDMKRQFLAMSEKLHIRIMKFDIDLDKDLHRIEALWDALQIPYFHRYYFESFIHTTFYKNIGSLIINE
jgi:hypothetical protein